MKANSNLEITVDSARSTTIQVAICLLVAVVVALFDIWRIVSGRVIAKVVPGTILIAVAGFVALFIFRPFVLKLAFALLSIQAAARIIFTYIHATFGVRHIVAMSAVITNLVAMLIVIFVIVDWFRSVARRDPDSIAENTKS
jgi:hypothetical protein